MEKRKYNVVLQSAIGNGASYSKAIFYDWTQLPDVPYIVTFSFSSSVITMGNLGNAKFPSIFVDLSQSYNQFAMPQTGTSAYKAYFLGNLLFNTAELTNFLTAESPTNPPTFLNGRPRSNNFTVEIRNNATTSSFPFYDSYCLILSFQEC